MVATRRARIEPSGPPPPRRLKRAGHEFLVASAVVAVGLAVIGLWWNDTPPGSLHSLGAVLIGAGDVTALLGTYLVLIEVGLLARVPWLDRQIGMDRLTAWHRWVGQYSITLLVAHAFLTLWGYALSDHTNVVSETKTVVLTYPDVLAATAGLGLLVAIGVVSARAARRRMKYHTWYFVHLYTYLAIALSFAHQLATGNDFSTHPANRAVWVLLYVAAFGAMIGWRVITPIVHAFRQRLRVQKVVWESPTTVSIYVSGNLDRLRAEAGQFFLWRFLTRDGWWQAHPYSLSAAPNSDWLRITVKVVGDHSAELTKLRPGTRVIAEGPYGAFTERRRTRRGVALIGAGIGITPLRALFESIPGDVVLIYRASDPDELVFAEELDEIAKRRRAKVHYVIGSRDKRPEAFRPTHLAGLVGDIAARDVFVCGPPAMIETVRRSLRALRVPRHRIHIEEFDY